MEAGVYAKYVLKYAGVMMSALVRAYSRAVCKIAASAAPMLVQQTGLFCMRQLSSAERLQGAPIGG